MRLDFIGIALFCLFKEDIPSSKFRIQGGLRVGNWLLHAASALSCSNKSRGGRITVSASCIFLLSQVVRCTNCCSMRGPRWSLLLWILIRPIPRPISHSRMATETGSCGAAHRTGNVVACGIRTLNNSVRSAAVGISTAHPGRLLAFTGRRTQWNVANFFFIPGFGRD